MACLIRSRPALTTPSSNRQHTQLRQKLAPCFAVNDKQTSQESTPVSTVTDAADEEARIEAIEASLRKAKAKGAPRRQIPIRNMTPKQERASTERAEWKPGQLFPKGWEQMPLEEKITELYLGQRGLLYWANQAAWFSAIGLGGAWILFRFVGPALGLYKLEGDLTVPPI